MTTRREFIFAAAAGAAMLTRISSALAATYDLVIKGGRLIDPAAKSEGHAGARNRVLERASNRISVLC